MKYKSQAVNIQQPSMNEEGVPAWLGDTFVSDDKDKTICAGFFRLEAGNPLEYTYDYNEMKYIVDGEFIITEHATGVKVHARKGDVFYFADGDTITFETPSFGVGFFCGQRDPL